MSEATVPNLDTEKLLDTTEAAKLLKVHRATIYRMILDGQLPAWKRGHRMLVKRADLDGVLIPVVPLKDRPKIAPTSRERRANDRRTMEILKRAGIV